MPARELGTSAAPAPSAAARAAPAIALACVIAAGLFVYRGALDYFFSADDFGWLARARGVLPPYAGFVRWIPYHLFWSIGSAWFGLAALPYHVAVLVAHVAVAAALLAVLQRRVGWPAAAAGALFYVVHPALYGSVYWISAIGDPLAMTFALLALVVLDAGGARRWMAAPLFTIALLCKESVIALPLAAFFFAPPGAGVRRALRDPVRWSLVGVAAAAGVAYFALDLLGVRRGDSAAYAVGAGAAGPNLLTYAGWAANFFLPTVRSFGDAVDPGVFAWGAAALAIAGAGLAAPSLRARGWGAGLALFAAGLLPVLPLERHTYHYYLVPALGGAAIWVAATVDLATSRLRPRLAVAAAAAVAILLTSNGALLVRKIERFPFTIPGLRSDPVVDRARIAENVIRDLRAAGLPPGVRLEMWSPTSRRRERLEDLRLWSYGEKNVRAALYDGAAVRLFFPGVRSVGFTPEFTPATDSVWYAAYRADGRLHAGPAPDLERALAANTGR